MADFLTPQEQLRLADLENQMVAGYLQTAKALEAIQQERLYREHGTWEEYLQTRWKVDQAVRGMTAARACQLIGAAAVVEVLTTVNARVLPQNERQARPLTQMMRSGASPEDIKEVIESAAANAPNGKPDHTHIQAAATRHQNRKPEPITSGTAAIVTDLQHPDFGQQVRVTKTDRDIIHAQKPSGESLVLLSGELQPLTPQQQIEQLTGLLQEVLMEATPHLSDSLLARIQAAIA